jgi:hypothetical protein
MPQEDPFRLVHGKTLANACEPPLDLDLPDFRFVPVHEGIVVLVPVAMFKEETLNEHAKGALVPKSKLAHLRSWEVDPDDGADSRRPRQEVSGAAHGPGEEAAEGDKDRQLASAFSRLKGMVGESPWTVSATPYQDLDRSFAAAAADPNVSEDFAVALRSMPFLVGAVGTFFAAVAMAASAEWWRLPDAHRGSAARGWFIGRWLPTALVVDGPIVRFIRSQAFRRLGTGSLEQVRAVRRFLSEGTVVAFRHGLAHWSFAWETRGDDNYVICHNAAGKCLTLHQEQADAIHIVTFAIVDVLYDRCLRHL